MFHKGRWHKVKEFESLEELVGKLCEYTWTLCTGFQWRDLYLLNDATCEDGAQEYAVIRNGRQIESLTVSWMSREELSDCLRRLASDPEAGVDMGPSSPIPHPEGSCCFCA